MVQLKVDIIMIHNEQYKIEEKKIPQTIAICQPNKTKKNKYSDCDIQYIYTHVYTPFCDTFELDISLI